MMKFLFIFFWCTFSDNKVAHFRMDKTYIREEL